MSVREARGGDSPRRGSYGGFGMSDQKTIVPSAGPYAGQAISVDTGEADRAITEGWASDPYAAPGNGKKAAKEPDDEARAKFTDMANAAARRWRGEETEGNPRKGERKSEPKPAPRRDEGEARETRRDMQADEPFGRGYETRAAATRSDEGKSSSTKK